MELSITQPDDWHLHLRDGDVLKAVVSHRFLVLNTSADCDSVYTLYFTSCPTLLNSVSLS